MIVNLIKRDIYPSLLYCGKRAGDVMERCLSATVIDSPADAIPYGGVLCLLYDDVPLLREKTLRRLYERCVRENTGFRLGDGFIKSVRFQGKPRFFACPELRKATPENFAYVQKRIAARILAEHRKHGVTIYSDDTITVDFDVKICAHAVLLPFTVLTGDTYVGENAVVERSTIRSSRIGDGTRVLASTVENSVVGDNCTVGPYAYLRQNARVGKNCRVGDFVEIKNSVLGAGVKAAHLTYVGDGEIGQGTNVGCGTVFCNYDGKEKRKVRVGENVFIGANSNLVAPLSIGDGAYLAAGGTITEDVPPSSFVIARQKQSTRKKK